MIPTVSNNSRFTQILAKSDKKRDIYIPEKSRYLNTIVVGNKNSGKTMRLLPIMAKQDIENKDCGATFVVGKKDIAYMLYAMAKKHKRKVYLLKPSTHVETANSLLWIDKYDYDYINDNVIDYKEVIKKKSIVIIDMEYIKYKNNSIRATAMLLLQLQLDMQEVDKTLRKTHFVYIDDAQFYLPYIETILMSGDEFNIGTTLFLQSRNQLKQKDKNYTSLIDNNIRSIILMNGLTMSDIEYYQKQFYEHNINLLINRKQGQIIYETIDSTNTRRNGFAEIIDLNEEYLNEMREKAIKIRKKMTKQKRKIEKNIESNASIKTITSIIAEAKRGESMKNNNIYKETSSSEIKKGNKILKEPIKKIPKPIVKKTPKEIAEREFMSNNTKQFIFDIDFDDEF
ncbi:TPA: conjugal transfer protein TraG [Clostridium botulinum]|nr:conjugal transfer protein TraG [Clostridium botulinum]